MKVSRTKLIGLALAIFAGTLWLYWPSIHGGFLTHMDDDEYLQQAARLGGFSWDAAKWAFTCTEPYYQPLPRLSHVLDYQLFATLPAGHHATSVAWHALNAALVFGFLWTLLGKTSSTPGERMLMAWAVAVVFAVHPFQVESVAWMSGRTQLMCMAFGVGCLWAHVAGARRWTVWALYAAALLCKPMAISFPFVMVAIDYFPLRRPEQTGWCRLLREKVVMVALAAAVMVATIVSESHTGGLMAPLRAVGPLQRISLMAQSLAFYPCKLVWPAGLSAYYPLSWALSRPLPLVLMLGLAVGFVTLFSVWRRQRTPALAAGWGAYFVLIAPVAGLVQTGGQAVAGRYAYQAIVPLLLLAAGAILWTWRRSSTALRAISACLLVCELGSFASITCSRIPIWRSDESLWRAVLVQFPDSEFANGMLAETLLRQNRIQEAVAYADRTVGIAPRDALAQATLGVALSRVGRFAEATGHLQEAVQLRPDWARAHNNLGTALAQQRRFDEAIAQFSEALRLKPDFPEARQNLEHAVAAQARQTH